MYNDRSANFRKGNQRAPGCWGHSPATFELFAAGDKLLTDVAELRGERVKQVEYVRAAMVEGSKTVYIFNTQEGDPDRIATHRYSSACWTNLITLLGPAKMTIRTGYRERFDVTLEPNSPVGPALAIDLTRVLERHKDSRRGKTKTQSKTDAKATVARTSKAADKAEEA
jgi:hypothetical protein